jgi:hypothetical protein
MHEIVCPHCKKTFEIDESGYADILAQVRDDAFEAQLHERLDLVEKANLAAIELAETKITSQFDKKSADQIAKILELESKLKESETSTKLTVLEAVSRIEKQRSELQISLEVQKAEAKLIETTLKEKYQAQLLEKDEQIAYFKDLKSKLSTKMIGETLEQHCEHEFNSIRAAAFPNSYFEKDNDSKSGSKGDYIFRESTPSGTELVSIMFEMKNESDGTLTKKKNVDYFKELDKDRIEKNCEYAVLVSLLESESDLYNNGIVDVSHKYPKMYVVRPQFHPYYYAVAQRSLEVLGI